MLARVEKAREIHRRLWNPPAGVISTELDIIAPPALRHKHRADLLAAQIAQLTTKLGERDIEIAALRGKLATADRQREHDRLLLSEYMAAAATDKQEKQDAPKIIEPELLGTPRFKIKQIVFAVATHFQVSVQGLLSKQKVGRLSRARFVLYALCYELTGLPLAGVGRALGRDHTTILYGVNAVKNGDETLKTSMAVVKEKLGAS